MNHVDFWFSLPTIGLPQVVLVCTSQSSQAASFMYPEEIALMPLRPVPHPLQKVQEEIREQDIIRATGHEEKIPQRPSQGQVGSVRKNRVSMAWSEYI